MLKTILLWDKDKNGALDENEIVDGLNQFIPPPGPGEPKKDFPGKERPKEKS